MGSLSEKVTSELKFKGWEDSIRDETKGGHWKLGGQEGKCPEDEASHSMNRTRLPCRVEAWRRYGLELIQSCVCLRKEVGFYSKCLDKGSSRRLVRD